MNVYALPSRSAAIGPNCLGRFKTDSTFTSKFRRSLCEISTIMVLCLKVPLRFDHAFWRREIDNATDIVKTGFTRMLS